MLVVLGSKSRVVALTELNGAYQRTCNGVLIQQALTETQNLIRAR